MSSFGGLPLPPGWSVRLDPTINTIQLVPNHGVAPQATPKEAYDAIAAYWNINPREKEDEQHRQATQAARNLTPTQHPAGNSGGAAAGGSFTAISSGYSQTLGAYTFYSPSQGTSVTMPGSTLGYGLGSGLYNSIGGQLLTAQQAHALAQQLQVLPQHYLHPTVIQQPLALPREAAKVGEIIGHRAWTLRPEGLLGSMSMSTLWKPHKVIEDRSDENNHTPIDDHNQSGIWAFKSAYDLAGDFGPRHYERIVYGTVWQWGTVIEHERGYRSQYASIRSLDHAVDGVDLKALQFLYLGKEGNDAHRA